MEMAFYQEDKSNGWLATSVMQHGDIFYHLSLHKLFLNIVDARFFFPIEITHQTLAYLNKRSSFKRKKTQDRDHLSIQMQITHKSLPAHIFSIFFSQSQSQYSWSHITSFCLSAESLTIF